MSWTKKTSGYFFVASETVTGDGSDTVYTSEIDWLEPGVDFVVISNYGATDLSNNADVDVYISDESGGTFVLLKADLETTINDAVKSSIYDVSSDGEAPVYKLAVVPDGDINDEDVEFKILQRK